MPFIYFFAVLQLLLLQHHQGVYEKQQGVIIKVENLKQF